MSIALMTAAFKAHLNHTNKFVLVALCDNANDQGECYPSVSMLCEKTSLSDRAVQKSIAYLVESKFMRRDIRNGRSTYYFIADPRTWFTPERGSPITINESSLEPSNNQKKARAFELPDWVPADVWDAFIEMRKQRKKAPTDYACKLVVDELKKLRDGGHDVKTILNNSIKNGWSDVYAPKDQAIARASPFKPEKFDPVTYMKNKREAQAKNERTIEFDAHGEPV